MRRGVCRQSYPEAQLGRMHLEHREPIFPQSDMQSEEPVFGEGDGTGAEQVDAGPAVIDMALVPQPGLAAGAKPVALARCGGVQREDRVRDRV